MNLWAKTLGRLAVLAVALFFFACADETSLLGFKNPNPKFNVSFVEIPIESSVLSIDSIYTDNKGTLGGLLIGDYQDNTMGKVHSEAYLQIVPNSLSLLPVNAVYDSLTVQFRFNFYSYGFTDEHTEKFTIHEITGDSINRLYTTRYVASSAIAYNPTPIDEAFVTVDYDSLTKQMGLATAQQDTLTAQARLSDEMGQRIFNLSQDYEFKKNNPDMVQFVSSIKGLVLVPSQSSGILGIRLGDDLTRVTLHYHTENTDGTKTALRRNFPFSLSSFSNITTDRSTSDLAALTQPYQDLQAPSLLGMRYLQAGTPVITKLDLSKFYAVADTMENVIVNEAELIISDVESPSGLGAHTSIVLKPMREDNQFFNAAVANDSVIRYNYVLPIVSSTDFLDVNYKHHFVNSDIPSSAASPARLVYSSSDKNYSTFVTLFTQTLFENKQKGEEINPNRLRYLALFPSTPSVLHTVNRTVFSADKIKLRIYYTTPTINQPE